MEKCLEKVTITIVNTQYFQNCQYSADLLVEKCKIDLRSSLISDGYQNMGSESTSTTATTTTYTTPSQYWVGSVADECPEKYMRSYLPNLEGGQFFIDGLLGESTGALAAKSDTDFTPITQAINTVRKTSATFICLQTI